MTIELDAETREQLEWIVDNSTATTWNTRMIGSKAAQSVLDGKPVKHRGNIVAFLWACKNHRSESRFYTYYKIRYRNGEFRTLADLSDVTELSPLEQLAMEAE